MTIDPRPLTPERREHLETIARRWDHSDDIRERSWSEAVTDLLAALLHAEIERDGWKARAEKDLGRRCILIEREERWAEIAAKRMAQSVLPLEAAR